MNRDIFGGKQRIKICKYCNGEIKNNEFHERQGEKYVCNKCNRFTEIKLANITEKEKNILQEKYKY